MGKLGAKGQVEFFSWPDPPPRQIPAEILHELSVDDKETLFRDVRPVLAAQKANGIALLQRLRELAPSIADNFELKPDLVHDFTMRLINGEKSPERSYIALSYCWSPASQSTPAPRYLHEQDDEITVPISGLLFQAAVAERMMADEGLWIDQVCINQNDEVEQSIAIPTMAVLYKLARVVLIALEDVEVDEAEQEFLKRFIPDFENSGRSVGEVPHLGERPAYMEAHPVFQRFFRKVCGSRWFTRAWCSHEMRLGQKHTFYMRCKATGSHDQNTVLGFSGEFLWYICALSAETPSPNGTIMEVRSTIKSQFDLPKQMEKVRRILNDQPGDLADVESYYVNIREIFMLGAGGHPDSAEDLRRCDANCDKMSIVLNIVRNGLNLKREGTEDGLKRFESRDECYRQLLVLALAAGDPLVLCALRQPLRTGNDGCSWLFQLDGGDAGSNPESGPLPLLSQPSFTIDQTPSTKWIELDGLIPCKPEWPPEIYISTATSMIEGCIEIDLGETAQGPGGFFSHWGPGPGYDFWRIQTDLSHVLPERRRRFIVTVACVLFCGMRWMLKVAKSSGFPQLKLNEWKKDAIEYFHEGFKVDELQERTRDRRL